MTQPSVRLVDSDPAELAVDAIVIGLHSQPDEAGALLPAAGAESITAAFDGRLTSTLSLLGATGAAGEVTKLATLGTSPPRWSWRSGLGDEPTAPLPAETLRRGTGAAVRALAGKARSALALPLPDDADAPGLLRAILEGALLGSYRFAGYKTKPQPGRREPVSALQVHVPDAADAAARAEVGRAEVVSAGGRLARDRVNAAPNDLRPPQFADAVAAAADGTGLAVEVLDYDALKPAGTAGSWRRAGFGARRRGWSSSPTRPEGATRTVALVGKGITFDSGGHQLKPAAGMAEMKSDMAGAAAVVAAMLAVAALAPPVAVTGYLPMAENMPSGSRTGPATCITMFGGKHGRGAEHRRRGPAGAGRRDRPGLRRTAPDHLVETSTLTGGADRRARQADAGVMGTPELCERVMAAGDAVGEPAWPMPLPDDLRKGMDSDGRRHQPDQRGHGPGRAHAAGWRVPARVRRRTGCRGRTSTSPGRRSTAASRRLPHQGRHRRPGPHVRHVDDIAATVDPRPALAVTLATGCSASGAAACRSRSCAARS